MALKLITATFNLFSETPMFVQYALCFCIDVMFRSNIHFWWFINLEVVWAGIVNVT